MDFALHHIGDDAREAGHHAATAQQVHTDIMDFRLSDIQHRISANLALPSRDTVESRMSTTRPSLVGDVTGTLRDVLCGNTSAQCEDVTGTLRNVLRGSKPALSRAPGTCQKAFPQAPAGSPGIAKRPIVGALTLDQGTSGEGPVCADASPANVHALEQCVDARALQMFRKVHLVDPPFGWVTVETTLIDGAPVTVTERTPGSVFLQRNSAENPRQVHTTLCSARNRDSTPVPPTSPIDVQITEDSSHLPTHASLAPSRPFSLMREKTKVQLNPRPVTEATVSVVPKSCPRPHTDGTMKPARTHGLKVKKWFGHAVLGDHYGSDASLLEKAENGKHGIRRADVFLETLDELQKAYTLAADRNTQESSYADASPGQACVDSDQAFQQSALSSRVRLDQQLRGCFFLLCSLVVTIK